MCSSSAPMGDPASKIFSSAVRLKKSSEEQLALCKRVMARGKFPYAHLDLMIQENGETHLAEINLRGGIKGAQICGKDYSLKVEKIHDEFLTTHGDKNERKGKIDRMKN